MNGIDGTEIQMTSLSLTDYSTTSIILIEILKCAQ